MLKKIYFIFIVSILFTSCNSSKKIVGASTNAKKMAIKKIVNNHKIASFDKKTLDAKLKLTYKNEKNKQALSVKLRIEKDKVIWLSASYLGFLAARVKITPTKVSYYEKLNKTYFDGDFDLLTAILGVEINFKQLQNIFFGETIFDIESSKYIMNIENNSYVLSPKEQQNLFDLFYWIHPSFFKLNKQQLSNNSKNQLLEISYPSYEIKQKIAFPKNIHIIAKEDNKLTEITMDFKTVDFDTEIETSFKIPSGYKQISL